NLAQKQRDAAKLDRAIRTAIEREIALAKKKAEEEARAAAAKAKAEGKEAPVVTKSNTSILASTPENAKLSADFISNRGKLPWPVANGFITVNYGPRKVVGNVTQESKGWTLRTNPGSSVRVVFDGVVSKIFEISGSQVIIVKHGEFFTIYKNLASVSVSSGQKVTTKQTLGTIATIDGAAELEFQLWKGTNDQNPSSWLAN